MKNTKLLLIIICSFLLGGLCVFAISKYQMQKIIRQDNVRLGNASTMESVDSQLISLLRDSFGKVFICLELGTQCHTQDVLSDIQKESIQVSLLNTQRQHMTTR